MKSILVIIFLGLVSIAFLPSSPKMKIDVRNTDSITRVAIATIEKSNKEYESEKIILCNSLSPVGDSGRLTLAKVRKDGVSRTKIKTVVKIVEKPVYYKIVQSIYSTRGAHVEVDTIKCY